MDIVVICFADLGNSVHKNNVSVLINECNKVVVINYFNLSGKFRNISNNRSIACFKFCRVNYNFTCTGNLARCNHAVNVNVNSTVVINPLVRIHLRIINVEACACAHCKSTNLISRIYLNVRTVLYSKAIAGPTNNNNCILHIGGSIIFAVGSAAVYDKSSTAKIINYTIQLRAGFNGGYTIVEEAVSFSNRFNKRVISKSNVALKHILTGNYNIYTIKCKFTVIRTFTCVKTIEIVCLISVFLLKDNTVKNAFINQVKVISRRSIIFANYSDNKILNTRCLSRLKSLRNGEIVILANLSSSLSAAVIVTGYVGGELVPHRLAGGCAALGTGAGLGTCRISPSVTGSGDDKRIEFFLICVKVLATLITSVVTESAICSTLSVYLSNPLTVVVSCSGNSKGAFKSGLVNTAFFIFTAVFFVEYRIKEVFFAFRAMNICRSTSLGTGFIYLFNNFTEAVTELRVCICLSMGCSTYARARLGTVCGTGCVVVVYVICKAVIFGLKIAARAGVLMSICICYGSPVAVGVSRAYSNVTAAPLGVNGCSATFDLFACVIICILFTGRESLTSLCATSAGLVIYCLRSTGCITYLIGILYNFLVVNVANRSRIRISTTVYAKLRMSSVTVINVIAAVIVTELCDYKAACFSRAVKHGLCRTAGHVFSIIIFLEYRIFEVKFTIRTIYICNSTISKTGRILLCSNTITEVVTGFCVFKCLCCSFYFLRSKVCITVITEVMLKKTVGYTCCVLLGKLTVLMASENYKRCKFIAVFIVILTTNIAVEMSKSTVCGTCFRNLINPIALAIVVRCACCSRNFFGDRIEGDCYCTAVSRNHNLAVVIGATCRTVRPFTMSPTSTAYNLVIVVTCGNAIINNCINAINKSHLVAFVTGRPINAITKICRTSNGDNRIYVRVDRPCSVKLIPVVITLRASVAILSILE